nr:SecD/SecF family protein translocase subunit [Actinomycetota bacterium]
FTKGSTCPTGQLAIVLDGRVLSAPSINSQSFKADQIEISGSFNERTAKDLATALKYGALPVEFEQQQAQVVSATLGKDALHAGLIAGLVGLIAVSIYMMAFYRVLGLFAVLKLGVEAALLWSIISWLGANNGLALTLAGITGIIVSIGVSLDSNVVYYEHLKEDINHGRSIRSATDKSFVSAFSTIVKADVASLIGAALLWWLTVGPVRGFAFYLGLSTALDLLTSWAYMRPVVKLATRSKFLLTRPWLLGLPAEKVQERGMAKSSNRPNAEVSQ